MNNLESTISEINRHAIPGSIWIDGSFSTEKLNPDDADIALIVSRANLLGLSVAQRQYFDNFSTISYYDQYRIDNYGIVLDQSSVVDHWIYAYWLRQFGWSRADEMKGIVLVSVPFLVVP